MNSSSSGISSSEDRNTGGYISNIAKAQEIFTQLAGLYQSIGSTLENFSELHQKILCDNASLSLQVRDLTRENQALRNIH